MSDATEVVAALFGDLVARYEHAIGEASRRLDELARLQDDNRQRLEHLEARVDRLLRREQAPPIPMPGDPHAC